MWELIGLFFCSNAVAGLFGSIMETLVTLLSEKNGHRWFFLVSCMPTLFDIFCIYLFSRLLQKNRINLSFIILVCTVTALLGSIMLFYFYVKKQMMGVMLGRAFVGVIYSQYPFFCDVLSDQPKNQALLVGVGLLGYFVSPILSFFFPLVSPKIMIWTTFLAIWGVFGCMFLLWALFSFFSSCNHSLEKQENEKQENEKKEEKKKEEKEKRVHLFYVFWVHIVWNLVASSLEYIISPILYRFYDSSSIKTKTNIIQEIGSVVSLFFFVLVLSSGCLYVTIKKLEKQKRELDPFSFNFWLIVFMLGASISLSFFLWVGDWSLSFTKYVVCACIIAHAIPLAGFMWTSVRFMHLYSFQNESENENENENGNKNKNVWMSRIGIVASIMYIVGPLVNSFFLVRPWLPIAIHFVFWCSCLFFHNRFQ